MAPVPDHPAIVVPYKDLLVYERKGVPTISVIEGDDVLSLNVRGLLDGVDLAGTRPVAADQHKPDQAMRAFVSYSHKDDTLRAELETHLKLLQRQRFLDLWSDRRIGPGTEWEDQIDENLEQADLVLLLVSADFINSDYCYDKEVTRALERHEAKTAKVIPIIVRDVSWRRAPFAKLAALPKDEKAVTTWGTGEYARDTAWRNVAEEIEKALEELRSTKGFPRP